MNEMQNGGRERALNALSIHRENGGHALWCLPEILMQGAPLGICDNLVFHKCPLI